MSARPIYRSLVNRLAVELPLFAKALVDDALSKHRLDPATVTPFELKRVIDEEIAPRLARILETSRSPHVSTLGGGLIQTAHGLLPAPASAGTSRATAAHGTSDPAVPRNPSWNGTKPHVARVAPAPS